MRVATPSRCAPRADGCVGPQPPACLRPIDQVCAAPQRGLRIADPREARLCCGKSVRQSRAFCSCRQANKRIGRTQDDAASVTPQFCLRLGGRDRGTGPGPLRPGCRRAVAAAVVARYRALASAQRFDAGLSRQGRGRLRRQDQDRDVRERPALSRSGGRQGADPGPGRDGGARQLDHHRHRPRRRLFPASGALRPADRSHPPGDRRQARPISQRPDRAEAALARAGTVARSGLSELVQRQQADRRHSPTSRA